MEKAGLIKALDEVKQQILKVNQLTADRHLQIKKYLREQEEGIKSLKTKILKVSKKKLVKN